MISKSKIKYIRSLARKKVRIDEGVFVAEGPKVVGDLLAVSAARAVFATPQWLDIHEHALGPTTEIVVVSDEELQRISFLQHPQEVLAVFPQFAHPGLEAAVSAGLSLMIDGVQDPGNFGTMIRIADWFGVNDIFCSPDTADMYNPKVVQATMGSIAHVRIRYTDLPQLADVLPPSVPVYGTFLDGDDLYHQELSTAGFIVMGNEGRGISPELSRRITRRLRIPGYPPEGEKADSLNVAIATAIVCSEFRRRQITRVNE